LTGPEWHAAERALAQAIDDADRHAERARVLERLHDVVARRTIAARPAADERRPAASAHYAVATALLALLVRDLLPDEQFSLLYAPVAEVVPRVSMRDACVSGQVAVIFPPLPSPQRRRSMRTSTMPTVATTCPCTSVTDFVADRE
jgi:hypothetical protein